VGGQAEKKSRYLVVIGASAGGPKAVLTVLKDLPVTTCGILVVQHLSHGFSGKFADFLNPQCRMQVKEARSGEAVCDGTVYIAPDGCQLTLGKLEDGFIIRCITGGQYQ
jgi:two-component system, chemotaxis family, protein-glutamate methylesterase/glutaminase